ncbi:hypothetical protein C5O00_11415 [Pukyongia salina]|uniref:Uncharacterized protein n=1 Tax=Pukyongia salina TaxID=2094025 RepID=A0A2S0HYR0_9FLAO|nr:hypothetical protein [Pukyongia salina]AVI51740.1 hypothetical protein C5O00_11415 [Pukyongia salina]
MRHTPHKSNENRKSQLPNTTSLGISKHDDHRPETVQLKRLQQLSTSKKLSIKESVGNTGIFQLQYNLKSGMAWERFNVGRAQNAGINNEAFYEDARDNVQVHFHVNGKVPQQNEFESFTATFIAEDKRFRGSSIKYHYEKDADGEWKWDHEPPAAWKDKAEEEAKDRFERFLNYEG